MTSPARRRGSALRATLVILVTAALAVLLPASTAQAHAVLIGSDPSDGATLATAPRQVQLRLSEGVVPGSTRIRMTDGTGRAVVSGVPQVSRTDSAEPGLIYTAGSPGAPSTITVDLPALAPDVYRIAWSTLSAADLHVTSGVVIFGVQRQAVAAGGAAADPLPSPVEVALRWLVLVLVGTGAAALVVLGLAGPAGTAGPDLPDGPRRRLLNGAASCSAVAAAAGLGLVIAQSSTDGISLRQLVVSSYGARWAVAQACALTLALVGLRAARRPGRRAEWTLLVETRGRVRPEVSTLWPAVVLLAMHAAAIALLGHAGAAALDQPVRFLADVAHVTAAQLWVGLLGVAVLLAADPAGRRHWGAVLGRFRPVAGTCVGVVSVSGLLLASTQVASVDALIVSTYGRLLLVKLALATLSAVAAVRVVRALAAVRATAAGSSTPPGLGGRVILEAGMVAAVVLLGAGVASSRPASGPEWVPASAAVPIRSGQPQDLVETVTVSPNRPGRNFVSVDVYQTRRPEPGPVTGVDAVLTRPGAAAVALPVIVHLTGDRPGRWVSPTDRLEVPGQWRIELVVTRQGVGVTRAAYDWQVADPQARLAAPVVSSRSLQWPLTGAAVLLALGLLALGWRSVAARQDNSPDRGDVVGAQPRRLPQS